jgi:chemosensory pili system protein ChpA (sensor histidine kinase/response regulator)
MAPVQPFTPMDPQREPAHDDVSTLAWVHEELRKTLESAHKALRRYLREVEAAQHSDLDDVEPTILRHARQQVHQGVGALELVNVPEGAALLRASETLLQRFVAKPRKLDLAGVEAVERASFALLDYVGRRLAGKPVSAVALFPQLRTLQEMVSAERIHPADLWLHDWRWRDIAGPGEPAHAADARMLAEVEKRLLSLVRSNTPEAGRTLAHDTLMLAAGAAAAGAVQEATLWRLAAGFFEAWGLGLLPPDVFVKRTGSRVMAQLRGLVKGGQEVSDRLAQDLLFYCARAWPALGVAAPALAAVQHAYDLQPAAPVGYEQAVYGRHDPALTVLARKRVAAAKEAWNGAAAGEAQRVAQLVETFSLVGDSMRALYAGGEHLARALLGAATATLRAGRVPDAALAMEVATSLLYLEAALDDGELDDPDQARRAEHLALRIESVTEGAPAHPLEPWMEELYRRVSDRQTMGSVVHELRASLSEAERQIDQFFRSPAESGLLAGVPGLLGSMRGVLSVLDIPAATQAVLRMREDTEALLHHDYDPKGPEAWGVIQRLAGNLGALGFLIDMLAVQPSLARSLFRFDAVNGVLAPVMGRSHMSPEVIDRAQAIAHAIRQDEMPLQEVSARLQALAAHAGVSAQPELAASVSQAQAALDQAAEAGAGAGTVGVVREHIAQAMDEFVATATGPIGLDPLTPPLISRPISLDAGDGAAATGLEDDEEMRSVFLEESAEVLAEARTACAELVRSPSDMAQLTQVRRAFHTLKGSSRMVGLTQFGEAAWACEQLYNHWLAELKSASHDLLTVTADAFDYLDAWTQAVARRDESGFAPEPVIAAADTLRLAGELMRIPLPDASEATAPAPAFHGVELPAGEVEEVDLEVFHEAQAAPIVETLQATRPVDLGGMWNASQHDRAGDADLSEPARDDSAFIDLLLELRPAGATPSSEVLPDAADTAPAADAAPETVPAEHAPTAVDDASHLLSDSSAYVVDAGLTVAAPADFMASTVDLGLDDIPPPELDEPSVSDQEADTVDLDLDLPIEAGEPEPAPPEEDLLLPTAEVIQLDDFRPSSPMPASVGDAAQVQAEDDQVKVIGPLRLAIPLFNIYLAEADELSRRLSTELSEWSLELHRPVGDKAVALAHSLAGNSATVGFQDLSELARSLEHALGDADALGAGVPDDAALFIDVADEIRRLLHQFAAGFLRAPEAGLLDRLHDWRAAAVQRLALREAQDDLASTLDASEAALPVAETAELTDESDQGFAPTLHDPGSLEGAPFKADFTDDLATPSVDELVPDPGEAAAPVLPDSSLGRSRLTIHNDVLDVDGDIDQVDQVDADLFPIFEEEAEELLPLLAEQVRSWRAAPADQGAATACMRTLHTFKGSARLAGAMRLGEMAHRFESAVARVLAAPEALPAGLEGLQQRSDALSAAFELLCDAHQDDAPPTEFGLRTPNSVLGTWHTQPAPLVSVGPDADEAPGDERAKVSSLMALEPVAETPVAQAPPVPARALAVAVQGSGAESTIDWTRFMSAAAPEPHAPERAPVVAQPVRVRAPLLDRLVNLAGEVSITRSRLEAEVAQIRGSLVDLTDNLERLNRQLHDVALQAETQLESRREAARAASQEFDPLELDRYTRLQELTRMMAESVNDVATVRSTLQRTLQTTEDELAVQARLTRELQTDLLRTRMVEFESLSERLYRVVRQASKETGKQVRFDIVGGSIEVDRGVLDRMTAAFEHLLRNCVTHGIETPAQRQAVGKDPTGSIVVSLEQEGNEVCVEVRDDGAGLDLERIRAKAQAMGLLAPDAAISDKELAQLIFAPGLSTMTVVTELAGRGVGMDVVRSDVQALGGRVETRTQPGRGTRFKLVMPLTTVVTQVVLLRAGKRSIAVPSNLVELVQRVPSATIDRCYETGIYVYGGLKLPFYWLGALLHTSGRGSEVGRTLPVVVVRSAQQRVALHVDEVQGSHEVVVKNLGPQLSRVPCLAGMTLLASGAVALIYNPLALSSVYGESAAQWMKQAQAVALQGADAPQQELQRPAPLVLVVDDSLTVRRITKRLLEREGYRVCLAKDGLEALDALAGEKPVVVLSDIEMPRMDGFDLLRNIRADHAIAHLPVIMITSRIAQKHRDIAMELGADHYLGKPYSEDELLALIKGYAEVPLHTVA